MFQFVAVTHHVLQPEEEPKKKRAGNFVHRIQRTHEKEDKFAMTVLSNYNKFLSSIIMCCIAV
jgi:hypothetical protein